MTVSSSISPMLRAETKPTTRMPNKAEIAAYFKGWHFDFPNLRFQYLYVLANQLNVKGLFDSLHLNWVLIQVEYLAPPLQFLTNVYILLFLVQSLDNLVRCLDFLWIRLKKIKPIPPAGSQVRRWGIFFHGSCSDPHVH
ncbi:putative xyloglucan glycosyltransferase 12 [Camellia lanceoleosa]|uniref:Xyloglucan glycosyltransferase 12 n=1 Tax=Camellia lanceoleosa TaxID=1840588 RepID=A0ACC0J2Q9_9ERIC|nr:putative xyloglucan glycosyltransferase 12 [Camellia lanceoleosa]